MRMALVTVLMGVGFASCSKEAQTTEDELVDEDYVDLSGLVKTDLKVDKKTFWLDDGIGGVFFVGDDEDAYISLYFDGKTEELECVRFTTIEPDILLKEKFLNTNKNIAEHLYIDVSEISSNYNWVQYDYCNGRASIRESDGVVIVNFNNVIFKNAETQASKILNGYISYRI